MLTDMPINHEEEIKDLYEFCRETFKV
jgi:hypothetical protein